MTAIFDLMDQESNKVMLHVFIFGHTAVATTVYTNDARAYRGIPFNHETEMHSLSKYVKGDVNAKGIEFLWSMVKRGHNGRFHMLSPKHLDRHDKELAGRHNLRECDTLDIVLTVAEDGIAKLLCYEDLIVYNGLSSGARS